MLTTAYVVAAALVAALIYAGIRYFVISSRRFGGSRVIICPETQKQAMVEVDTTHAAFTSLIGQTDLRLASCWRWPMRENCGQECLLQLDVAPANCLVRSVLKKWYRGKKCAFCERPFDDIESIDRKPALLNLEGITLEWAELPMDTVTKAMATYLPVCWNCHIAQSFRRQHPDLVVERPMRQPSCSRMMIAK
jgi:hypothetical protein